MLYLPVRILPHDVNLDEGPVYPEMCFIVARVAGGGETVIVPAVGSIGQVVANLLGSVSPPAQSDTMMQ